MKIFTSIILLLLFCTVAPCQKIYFPVSYYADSASLANHISLLANQVIANYKQTGSVAYYDTLFRLQIVAKNYKSAIHALDTVAYRSVSDTDEAKAVGFHYRIYSLANDAYTSKSDKSFDQLYEEIFSKQYTALAERGQDWADNYFNFDLASTRSKLDEIININKQSPNDSIALTDAIKLCRSWCTYIVYSSTGMAGKKLITKVKNEKYITDDSVVLTMPDGGTVSLTIVRDKDSTVPQPVVLMYTIYSGYDELDAREAVRRGYVGIVANTRGKRLSKDAVEPFEHDAKDAYNIIDWISKQPWCNGKVGMYGGSYLGFAQWSAVKYIHPALKTIVPMVAVGIGVDYPMQNNVYMSYMLKWIHYVANNKNIDLAEFSNANKWDSLFTAYYKLGKSFRSLDSLDGRPNAIFQRWLNHPSYDSYWKNMTPQKEEFAKINIPILTISGYWDDDQLGALYYYKQHYLWNKNANDYLLIGPFDHGGSQWQPGKNLFGYTIDPVADINIGDIVFQWFDHVLKDSSLPSILSNKVNFEVMGANEWKHVPSLRQMSNDTVTFYLSNKNSGNTYQLLAAKPATEGYISQQVDFRDTAVTTINGQNISAFATLIDSTLHPGKKLVFISGPMAHATIFSGSFIASIIASVNKKDIDLVADMYVQMPDGKYFALNETVQRASYANDRTTRHLLQPGKVENINMHNNFLTCVQLPTGSRLIFMIGINKDPNWEINYGSGGDVSKETVNDAKEPLEIKWYNTSTLKVPVWR